MEKNFGKNKFEDFASEESEEEFGLGRKINIPKDLVGNWREKLKKFAEGGKESGSDKLKSWERNLSPKKLKKLGSPFAHISMFDSTGLISINVSIDNLKALTITLFKDGSIYTDVHNYAEDISDIIITEELKRNTRQFVEELKKESPEYWQDLIERIVGVI